jgi:dihydropyrimidinase
MRKLIINGTVVSPDGAVARDIVIEDGVIADVVAPGTVTAGADDEVIDAAGLHVFPGIVEPHAHIGLGAPTDWETESSSAARGGVTTVFNYVMGSASYFEQVPAEHAAAGPNTHVDYALHIVPATQQHLEEFDDYVRELGVTSFKFFMSFRGDEGKYLGIPGSDDGYMYEYLRKVAAHPGAVANVHAENIEVVWKLRKEVQDSGADGLPAFNASRPDFTEAEALARAAFFGRVTKAPVYIVHTSAKMTLEEAAVARGRGGDAPLYMETCAHYLTHTEDSELGVLAKANPPLRSSADRDALWAALADGSIQTVGSDHSGRHRSKKAGTVWQAANGLPGIGNQLTVLLSEGHHKRGLPLERIVELVCANPARIFGVYPQKGVIAAGADADFALIDLDEVRTVTPTTFGGAAEYNVYEGWDMKGWPVATILRGEYSYRDGEVVSAPGTGQYIFRTPHQNEEGARA